MNVASVETVGVEVTLRARVRGARVGSFLSGSSGLRPALASAALDKVTGVGAHLSLQCN